MPSNIPATTIRIDPEVKRGLAKASSNEACSSFRKSCIERKRQHFITKEHVDDR